MDEYEQYIFDLNGYLVIEDILTTDQVAALNEALDRNLPAPDERPAAGLNEGSVKLSGAHGGGTFGGCLDWPEPWCDPFRALMALPPAGVALHGRDHRRRSAFRGAHRHYQHPGQRGTNPARGRRRPLA